MGNYNKTSLCILALLILSVSSASSWRSIVLTQNNHVAIRGSINSQSISDVLYKLGTEIVPTLNGTHNEIFIYLNSGGGTVYAGNKLIEEIMFLQNRNVTVSCIGSRDYSMAFDIFQACDNRYITPTATLMQHQMSAAGISGSFENLLSEMDYMKQIYENLLDFQSKRLNMTTEQFRDKIRHDWWLVGKNAVTNNAADQVALVDCEPILYRTNTTTTVSMMFLGDISITQSNCPLILAPLKVDFGGLVPLGIDGDELFELFELSELFGAERSEERRVGEEGRS